MGCGASQSVATEAVDGHHHDGPNRDAAVKGAGNSTTRAQISPRDRTAVVIDGTSQELKTSHKSRQSPSHSNGAPAPHAAVESSLVTLEGRGVTPVVRGLEVSSQQPSSLRNSSSTDPTPPNSSGQRLRVGLVAIDTGSASTSSNRHHHAAVSPANLNLTRIDSAPVSPMRNVCSEGGGDHSLQEHTIGTPMGGSGTTHHRPMFQVNSFAASKSFRRQSYYNAAEGGGGLPVATAQQAVLAPRVRNRSLARSQLLVQHNSGSFSSVASDGSCTRVPSMAVLPSSVVLAGDLRNGRISREERLSGNPLRATYLASEVAPQKVYYVLKVLHTRFLLSVAPGEPTSPRSPPVGDQDQGPKQNARTAQRQDILADLPTLPAECMHDPALGTLDGRVPLSLTLLQKMGHKNMQSIYSVMTVGSHVLALGEFYFKSNIADEEIFDDAKICTLTKEVVRALYYSHSHHIPHGHLTLSNIYVKDNNTDFAVSDFGMAHLFLSLDLDALYTIGYTDPALHPPERIEAMHRHHDGSVHDEDNDGADVASLSGAQSGTNSPRAPKHGNMESLDLWALGCCIFEKRFGRRAFEGASITELHNNILNESPEFPPWCDNNLYHLLTRLLSKDPAHRGPFHAVLREPFIRHRLDVSKSLMASSGGGNSSSLSHSNHDEVEIGNSGKGVKSVLWRRGSSIAAAAAAAAAAASAAEDPPSFYYVDDEVLCSNCRQLCKVVCYQCMQCPGFRVCRSCQYQNNFEHEAGHDLEALAMDSTVPLDATTPLDCGADPAASPGSRPGGGRSGHRGTLLIATSQLTDREATIFAMTGTLPMCLEVERNARCTTQRTDVAHKQIQLMGVESNATPPSHPLSGSDAIQPTSTAPVAANRQLMTEAAAYGEEECADSVIEANGLHSDPELLLSNFDLVVVPSSILDPPFAHVTVLDLANNCLTSIPESIEYLVNLRRFLLGNNKLTALPESIGNLTDLEHLDVNHNQLSTLPQSLMFCDQMEVLALDYNAFVELPLVLGDVEVRTVFLAANPGIERWPSVDVMKSFPRGMTIGLDNDPTLFREAMSSPLMQLLADRQIHVAWNKIYPDFVLPGVYLGSLRSAQSLEVYAKVGITHVLTMGRGLDALPPPGGQHKIVIVDDLPGASIDFAFEDAVTFIDDAVTSGGAVLVHCFAGMSRSATTVIAYLMMRRGMRLDDAYNISKRGRPAIYPNAGFFDQLLALDAKLFPGQRPLDIPSMEREKVP